MSLDYDLTKIKNRSVHFPPNTEHTAVLGTLNLKIHAMIWGTIATGIGEIRNEVDADDFYTRYAFWHRLIGGEATLPFTREDVRNAVGLSTNVFPRLHEDHWLKGQFERFASDLLRNESVSED